MRSHHVTFWLTSKVDMLSYLLRFEFVWQRALTNMTTAAWLSCRSHLTLAQLDSTRVRNISEMFAYLLIKILICLNSHRLLLKGQVDTRVYNFSDAHCFCLEHHLNRKRLECKGKLCCGYLKPQKYRQ